MTVPVARLTAPAEPVGQPAWWLRDAMVMGKLGVREVIEAHLQRLVEVDPYLNASTVVAADAALADADRLQAALSAGITPGPLFGVPFTVKDILATAGIATDCGSKAFAGNLPVVDAVAVRRLREAGAVLLAKSSCPEFAFGVTTDSDAHGVTHSPWGDRSPGGSSGGEAALIAAGASALGLGTDYGGSLRWPAQSCGVLALRPGLGTVDGTGQLPEAGGRMDGNAGPAGTFSVQRAFQVVGPMARTVRDLGLALSALTGRTAGQQLMVERPAIGWIDEDSSQHVGTGVQRVIRELALDLQGAGFSTHRLPGVLDGLHETFNALRATDPMTDLRVALAWRQDRVGPVVGATLAREASRSDPGPLWDRLRHLRETVLDQLTRTPLLIVAVAPASSCDLAGAVEVDGVPVQGFDLMAQCRAVSALGFPALSIPVGMDRDGWPVSVQLVAGPGGEELVLALGALLEELGGGCRLPPWLPA